MWGLWSVRRSDLLTIWLQGKRGRKDKRATELKGLQKMEEKLHEHNWKKLGNFERKYKEMFLKRLTKNEGLEMLNNLYKFVQEIGHRKDYKKLDLQKIQTLSKVHSIFMKVNP